MASALSKICKRHDILVILDDIQAGCGRTGTFFSFEPSGIQPDIVTLSKSIGGYGLPMAITLFKPELDVWKAGEHNGTFRGNNHAFVTAAAAIEHFWSDDRFEKQIKRLGKKVTDSLTKLLKQYPELFVQVKGRGLMQGIECRSGDLAGELARLCFENGMVIETAGPGDEVVKFFCPLIITDEELMQGLSIFSKVVEKIAENTIQKHHKRIL